jgi:hypothetical protein
LTFNWFQDYFSIDKGHESGSQNCGPLVSLGPWSTVDQVAWWWRCSLETGARPLRGSGAHRGCTGRRRSGRSSPITKDDSGQQIQPSSGVEQRLPWMLVSVVTMHNMVARGWPVAGSWSRGERGEKLGRLGQLSLDYQVKRDAGVKMEKRIETWIMNFGLMI